MIVIGLTGSIGMGKSTVAAQFASLGIAVCSADDLVHALMRKGGKAVSAIEKAFPGIIHDQAVDRKKLGDIVFKDKNKLAVLEHILHPLVVSAENDFIRAERCKRAQAVVLEIPLLFETGAEARCDQVIVVTAPAFMQKQRVLKRARMTPDKFEHILSLQMPDAKKRQKADMIIQTGLGKHYSFKHVLAYVRRWNET